MNQQTVSNVAKNMTTFALFTVARSLNAELMARFADSTNGTLADMGRIEMAQACTDELVSRGYLRGYKADGSDLPFTTCVEDGIRYSMQVRVF